MRPLQHKVSDPFSSSRNVSHSHTESHGGDDFRIPDSIVLSRQEGAGFLEERKTKTKRKHVYMASDRAGDGPSSTAASCSVTLCCDERLMSLCALSHWLHPAKSISMSIHCQLLPDGTVYGN